MFPKIELKSIVISVSLVLVGLTTAWADGPSVKPEPKAIAIGSGEQGYLRLLGGPPASVTMRAGAVTLQPGKTVGKHNTESYEEFIVVLEGRGLMILSDGRQMEMKPETAVYCPPDTEHDVKNTGSSPLRYVYVVAKTRLG